MTDREKLQKIIANYVPLLHYTKIILTATIQDKYIAEELKHNFCQDICRTWQITNNTHSTKLHNEMFKSLKTGDNILKFLEAV